MQSKVSPTPNEKWKTIYQALFPNTPLPSDEECRSTCRNKIDAYVEQIASGEIEVTDVPDVIRGETPIFLAINQRYEETHSRPSTRNGHQRYGLFDNRVGDESITLRPKLPLKPFLEEEKKQEIANNHNECLLCMELPL